MPAKKPVLLVTGASGQLGRRTIEFLLEKKAGQIIAATRNPDKLADLAARGVDVRAADFDDSASLTKAFAGADRLLLISTDALGRPGGRHAHQGDAVKAAVSVGVRHVLYTSVISPFPSETEIVPNDHFWTEQAIIASGVGWTFLRNSIYDDVILWTLPQAVKSGKLFTATGRGGKSFVTREDCARIAAAALASDFEGTRILDVTGPAPVTQDEIAALATELTGRKVEHVAISPEELRKNLIAAGVPEVYVGVSVSFDVITSRGYYAVTTPAVEELTGRKPTSVREFLTAHRAALAAAN